MIDIRMYSIEDIAESIDESLADFKGQDCTWIIATEDCKIVGCLGVTAEGDIDKLHSLVVSENKRRKGVAVKLVEHFISNAFNGSACTFASYKSSPIFKGLGFKFGDSKKNFMDDNDGLIYCHMYLEAKDND